MRIEHEGYVQHQPTYQHVGYLSAGIDNNVILSDRPFSGLFFGFALLCAVMALSARRSSRGWIVKGAALILAVLAGGGVLAGAWSSLNPTWNMAPLLQKTIVTIERLSAETEAFAKENGRLPTEEEWTKAHTGEADLDGWGNPLIYTIQEEPDSFDGQLYRIATYRERYVTVKSPVLIGSDDFGPDGIFGTDDDKKSNITFGILQYRKVDLSDFPHGRAPRAVKVPQS